MNAEERFIPHLREINRKFPKLRIVLEHCTTAAAVEAVRPPLPRPLTPLTFLPVAGQVPPGQRRRDHHAAPPRADDRRRLLDPARVLQAFGQVPLGPQRPPRGDPLALAQVLPRL